MLQAVSLPPWSQPLRRWQIEAGQDASLRLQYQRDLVWIVTPAGGKTVGSGYLAWWLLTNGFVDAVIYAVPKANLCEQVAASYARHGMQLDSNFENTSGCWSPEFIGAVVTYQQIGAAPEVFQDICSRYRTLVIGDEWHHVGEDASWGQAMRTAFDDAAVRLILSGTLFRTDETPVPYVEYDVDGAIPDFVYDYPQGIADDVCREAVFRLARGGAHWITRSGEERFATFDDVLSKSEAAERLRTMVSSQAFGEVIRNAHQQLLQIRHEEHNTAGGLIAAMDMGHARTLAHMVQTYTGTEPELVVSADRRAGDRIRAFGESDRPWIVAVHMVSEGTDVPRLRVGVFGSNVKTELYFRQFIGRFVRKQAGYANDRCYIYAPADPVLASLAHRIHDEVKQGVRRRTVSLPPSGPQEAAFRAESQYQPLDAYTDAVVSVAPMANLDNVRSLSAQKRDLRRDISRLVKMVAAQNHVLPRSVNAELIRRFGTTVEEADLDDLRIRKIELQRWLREGYDG